MVETLQHQVITLGFLIVYQVEDLAISSELEREPLQAYATLELLPVEGRGVLLYLLLLLLGLPLLKTFKVDEGQTTLAFTSLQ